MKKIDIEEKDFEGRLIEINKSESNQEESAWALFTYSIQIGKSMRYLSGFEENEGESKYSWLREKNVIVHCRANIYTGKDGKLHKAWDVMNIVQAND